MRLSMLLALASLLVACDPASPPVWQALVTRDRDPVGTAPLGQPAEPDPVAPDAPGTDPVPPDPVTPDPDPTPADPDPVTPDPDPTTGACGAELVCVDTFPFTHAGDTLGGPRRLDAYACAPDTREGGPERVYRVELPADGLLVASLSDVPDGVDVDVHILDDLDAAACRDRGHWNAAARLAAGTAWVVVDSWVDASGGERAGPYTLTLGFTSATALEGEGLDAAVLDRALHVFDRAWQSGDTDSLTFTVIDFSLHSSHPRLWTLDLSDGSVLFTEPVSHGAGSEDPANPGYAYRFSNVVDSHQSSLGLMRTGSRYISSANGLSLRLVGLDEGINDRVFSRAIVVHSDAYASAAFLATHGRLGNSWGCQVIDPARIDDFIGTIEEGTLMWTYFPDDAFLDTSVYLDGY
jgi:hypothetical protein